MTMDFNYDLAIRQAGQIEEVAREMRGLANGKLASAAEAIAASWAGDASEILLLHCGETKRQVIARADKLDRIARRIREAARMLTQAEMYARNDMGSIN